MEQNDFYKWKRLKGEPDNFKLPENWIKGFISLNHLIIVSSSQIYTFHLKDLYWSQLSARGESLSSLSSRSCLVRPGLIADLRTKSNKTTSLECLTFKTKDVPNDFEVKSHDLISSAPTQFSSDYPLFSDQTSLYTFGHNEQSRYTPWILPGLLYQTNFENKDILEVKISGNVPCKRRDYQSIFHHGKLYLYGGYNDKRNILYDLWVLDLGELKWEKLQDINTIEFKPFLNKSPFLLTFDDQILLCLKVDSSCAVLSYNPYADSWSELRLAPDTPKFNDPMTFVGYQDSIILFTGQEVYSLRIPSKTNRFKGGQLKNLIDQLFIEKTHADITFKVEDEEFPANKCILSLRSPYFKNMFSSKMMESQSSAIPVPNVRAKVFKVILEYIYLSDIKLDNDIGEDLFKLAHEYLLEELKDECEEFLAKNIDEENVIKTISFAEQYEAMKLRKACLVFIMRNRDEVFKKHDIKELESKTILELFTIEH